MTFLREKDVVVLASLKWNFLWQRHQIFATSFCQVSHRVVFIEVLAYKNPGIRDVPRIMERLVRFAFKKGRRKAARKDSRLPENLTVISPLVLPSTFPIYRKINNKILVPLLAKLIFSRGLRNPIVLNYLPHQAALDLIQELRPSLLIYDCVTNFPQFPGVPKDSAVIEKKIIQTADLVFTDSPFLDRKVKQIRADVQRIMPGVDFDHFQQADSGRLQNGIRTLGYFGGINEVRIDFGLLKEIASGGPWEIHMIGPVRSRVPRLPENIIFRGEVSYRELPGYLRGMDCLILPYKLTEFTKGIIPAKLFECLATGKPLIATPLPSFDEFGDLIYLAGNARDFLNILAKIRMLETPKKYEQRKELARRNSWESRFQEMAGAIQEKLAGSS